MLRTSRPKVTEVCRRVDVVPGLRGGGPVEEHQEDAGDREQDEEEEAEPAEAERVADLHRVALHLHRVQVVQHRVHDHVGAVPGAVGVALPEDRAGPEDRVPGLRALDLARCSLLTRVAHASCRGSCRRWSWPRCSPAPRTACRRRSRGCWCACGSRRPPVRSPTLPEDDHAGRAPVDAEGAAGADVVVDDEHDVVVGSSPGCSVSTASAMASGVTMWMHFHGQMSTQPSHMMHSDWSMWMNCFGLTALAEVVGVDLDELVLVAPLRHRRVGIGAGHLSPS